MLQVEILCVMTVRNLQDNPSNTVFVGIPCYRRHQGLANTIRCLQRQTHTSWTAVIFDNASPDQQMREVAEAACAADSRIRYFRHDQNIGAAANFRFAAMHANTPYFMWASDDDQWHPDFMAANLSRLTESPQAQMSFCSVEVINVAGKVLFQCPGFSRFCFSGDQRKDAENFLEDPETLGKANLIYGIYRTPAVQDCVESFWDRSFARFYGGDFVFLYAFICRHAVVAHDAIHMRKRQPTRANLKIHWRHPRSYRVSRASEFESFIARFRDVAPTTELADLAETILLRRQKERFLYYLPFLGALMTGRAQDKVRWSRMSWRISSAATLWGEP
jgi:glycosyltransferase involved in cell wall biosynthesis